MYGCASADQMNNVSVAFMQHWPQCSSQDIPLSVHVDPTVVTHSHDVTVQRALVSSNMFTLPASDLPDSSHKHKTSMIQSFNALQYVKLRPAVTKNPGMCLILQVNAVCEASATIETCRNNCSARVRSCVGCSPNASAVPLRDGYTRQVLNL